MQSTEQIDSEHCAIEPACMLNPGHSTPCFGIFGVIRNGHFRTAAEADAERIAPSACVRHVWCVSQRGHSGACSSTFLRLVQP